MKNILRGTCIAMTVMTMLYLSSCGDKEKETGYDNAINLCVCNPSWFPHSQTPAPAEGVGSPFDTSSTTNCIFHQWSWQKFLWLTKPTANNRVLFQDSMIQVDNQMIPVPAVNGVQLVLTDIGQAGTDGVLRSNPAYNGNNISDTVYYGIYINPTLKHAADSFKNALLADTAKLNNNFTFPVGSLELKTSWISITALPANDTANYFITDAIIQPSGKKVRAALLGMHVVGVVINHPEFIWATFEHRNMAPVYNWAATTNQDLPVTSSTQNLFFQQGDTATWKNLQWPYGGQGYQSVFNAYPFGVPKTTNNTYMPTSQQEPLDYDNIQEINACVALALNDVWNNYFYNGSIWINTDGLTPQQQADTIVSLGYNIGSATPNSIARGSLACYNITMETFVQVDTTLSAMNNTQLTNCFSCHSSPANIKLGGVKHSSTSPLYLSHIFRSYLSRSTGLSVPEIERIRINDFLQMENVKSRTMKK